jgi:hypothetical protein
VVTGKNDTVDLIIRTVRNQCRTDICFAMRLIQLSAARSGCNSNCVFTAGACVAQAAQKEVVELMMHEQHDTVNV